MINIDITEAMRLQDVKRWAMMDVLREQSVAEHSFNVALIAVEYATRTNRTSLQVAAMAAAMIHDLFEVFTGDVPTPVKRAYGIKDPDFKFNSFYAVWSDSVVEIVKMADIIEAAVYLYKYAKGPYSQKAYDHYIRLIRDDQIAFNLYFNLIKDSGRTIQEVLDDEQN